MLVPLYHESRHSSSTLRPRRCSQQLGRLGEVTPTMWQHTHEHSCRENTLNSDPEGRIKLVNCIVYLSISFQMPREKGNQDACSVPGVVSITGSCSRTCTCVYYSSTTIVYTHNTTSVALRKVCHPESHGRDAPGKAP